MSSLYNIDIQMVRGLTRHLRFNGFPAVTGEPFFRFYYGMPLINAEGYALGALCVLDFEPRELAFEQQRAMRRLAGQVIAQLELRRSLIKLEEARTSLQSERDHLRHTQSA